MAALGLALLAGCASPGAPAPAPQSPPAPPPAPPPEVPMTPEEVAFREEAASAQDRGLPILIAGRSYLEDRFEVAFYNVSGREFQDISFELVPYDSTGRRVGAPATLRFTGPVLNSRSLLYGLREGSRDEVWNEAGISCVEITGIELTWMNGERSSYSFDTVSRMYREDVEKWCRFAS